MPLVLVKCACGHGPEHHEHHRVGLDCGSCLCPRYRPVRLHWWQFWRPRPPVNPLPHAMEAIPQ